MLGHKVRLRKFRKDRKHTKCYFIITGNGNEKSVAEETLEIL